MQSNWRAMKALRAPQNGRFAGSWPPVADCNAFIAHDAGKALRSETVLSWAASNSSLVSYLYHADGAAENNVQSGWTALTPGCRVVPLGCWCFHVRAAFSVRAVLELSVSGLSTHQLVRCPLAVAGVRFDGQG